MRSLPIMTGVLTIVLVGGIGLSLLSAGSTTWGAILLGFAALRAVLMLLQIQRIRQAQAERDRDLQD